MSNLSSELEIIARQLLTEFGELASFLRIIEGSYIPSTSSTGSANRVTFTGYCAPMAYSFVEANNETILQSDVKLLVEKTSVPPLVGDTVTVNSVIYRVLNVSQTVATGKAIIYTLQLRA